MKYKLVIFDFDGTLADSFPWFVQMVNSVAIKYNFRQVQPEEVDSLRSLSATQLVSHLEIPFWKMPMIANHVRQRMTKEREGISLFPGISEILTQLHAAGLTLALVTSNSYDNVLGVMGEQTLSLMSYVEHDIPMLGKRARYRKVLKQSGIAPAEAISISDEIRDLEASVQEKIPFGAVAWGYTNIEALMALSPAEVFMQVEDILRLLQ